MDKISKDRERVLINGAAKSLRAVTSVMSEKLIGRLEGIVEISGDIESPIGPPEVWEAFH